MSIPNPPKLTNLPTTTEQLAQLTQAHLRLALTNLDVVIRIFIEWGYSSWSQDFFTPSDQDYLGDCRCGQSKGIAGQYQHFLHTKKRIQPIQFQLCYEAHKQSSPFPTVQQLKQIAKQPNRPNQSNQSNQPNQPNQPVTSSTTEIELSKLTEKQLKYALDNTLVVINIFIEWGYTAWSFDMFTQTDAHYLANVPRSQRKGPSKQAKYYHFLFKKKNITSIEFEVCYQNRNKPFSTYKQFKEAVQLYSRSQAQPQKPQKPQKPQQQSINKPIPSTSQPQLHTFNIPPRLLALPPAQLHNPPIASLQGILEQFKLNQTASTLQLNAQEIKYFRALKTAQERGDTLTTIQIQHFNYLEGCQRLLAHPQFTEYSEKFHSSKKTKFLKKLKKRAKNVKTDNPKNSHSNSNSNSHSPTYIYESRQAYKEFFEKCIQLEKYEEIISRQEPLCNVALTLSEESRYNVKLPGSPIFGQFKIPNDQLFKIQLHDAVSLSNPLLSSQLICFICFAQGDEYEVIFLPEGDATISVYLQEIIKPSKSGMQSKWEISQILCFTSYMRQFQAVLDFCKPSFSPQLAALLMGSKVNYEENQSISNVIDPAFIPEIADHNGFNLNPSQRSAIEQSLRHRISTIQGAPGTGKTVSLALLAFYLHKTIHSQYQAHQKRDDQRARDSVQKYELQRLQYQKACQDDGERSDFPRELNPEDDIQARAPQKPKHTKHAQKPGPILICGASNVATDNATIKLIDVGLKVVRISSSGHRHLGLALNSQVENRTLHKLLDTHLRQNPDSELALLHKKVFGQGRGGDLSLIYGKLANWLEEDFNHQHSLDPENHLFQTTHSMPEHDNSELYSLAARILRRAPKASDTKVSQVEERRYKLLLHEARSAILQNADVITTTCVLSGDRSILGKFKFTHVIIDEVSQTLEPELLIPMTYQAQHVVLIGDDKQLGPICRSEESKRLFYNHSLFFRLSQTKTCYRTLLNEQYRMHPAIARFSSSVFYDDNILNGVDEKARSYVPYSAYVPHFAGDNRAYRLITHKICVLHPFFFPWPNPRVPIAFIPSIDGQEKMKGFSKYNIAEALWVERIIAHLVLRGLHLKQIGVISPYAAQNTAIINILKDPQRMLIDAIRQRNKTNFPLATAANALEEIHDYLQVATVDAFQGQEREFIIFSAVATKFVGFLKDERRLNVALTRAQYGFFLIANEDCLRSDKTWAKLFTHFTVELQCKMSSRL